MQDKEELLELFRFNPEFVFDVFHAHFLRTKTYNYYEYAVLNILHEIDMDEVLRIKLIGHHEVLSYTKEKGQYIFETKKNALGFAKPGSFYDLWCSILAHGTNARSSEDLFNRFYLSENFRLIKLADDMKKWIDQYREELYKLISKEECNFNRKWTWSDLKSSKINFKLLSLNLGVWNSLFLSSTAYFSELKNQISLPEGHLSKEGHFDYVSEVNLKIMNLIDRLPIIKSETKKIRGSWECSVCDGDSETGCLMSDPLNCPYDRVAL